MAKDELVHQVEKRFNAGIKAAKASVKKRDPSDSLQMLLVVVENLGALLLDKMSIVFICPFCNSKAAYRESFRFSPTVVHALPMCKKFYRLPSVEYLKQVREELERRAQLK